jgi:hypothetical protein
MESSFSMLTVWSNLNFLNRAPISARRNQANQDMNLDSRKLGDFCVALGMGWL